MSAPVHLSGNEKSGQAAHVDHTPVLLDQAVQGLAVAPGLDYVDCTLGGAGHASAILDVSAPDGRLLGLDADPEAVERCAERLARYGDRVRVQQGSFADLEHLAKTHGFDHAHGVLFDLGLSSFQLASPERGFSFRFVGPLDMRFDTQRSGTAADLVNELPENELADLLWRYGEERASRQIARQIVRQRPIRTTAELTAAVGAVVGRRGRLHPSTKVFMALRIATNREIEALETGLSQAVHLLVPGKGRLAVLSYHSLEDRLVKRFFRAEARDCICPPDLLQCECRHRATLRILTRKPIRPQREEVMSNPRSRSARLRIAERLH